MNYLLAAQSLAYFAASAIWVLVWRNPSRMSVGYAGLATAFALALAAFRLSLSVVAGVAP